MTNKTIKNSLAKRILNAKKPFVFFHTHCVTEDILKQAIAEEKSMDFDVCIDDSGTPYLGHSREYYEKSGDVWDKTMSLWRAVDMISNSPIPVILDCKHYNAWEFVEEIITKIGPARCLVHTFVSELDFNYNPREFDISSEWSPIERLRLLKDRFPLITTTASAKGLPNDLLVNNSYKDLLFKIRNILKDSFIDTACLNIPYETVSDQSLDFFLEEKIIPHVTVDNINTKKLSKVYIGETDYLKRASKSSLLV